MTSSLHRQKGWDMHDHGAEIVTLERNRLDEGAPVNGVVVCHHPFGLGVYLADVDQYGHVNITAIGTSVRGPNDFPAVGSAIEGTVLGYSGMLGQLTLTLQQQSTLGE